MEAAASEQAKAEDVVVTVQPALQQQAEQQVAERGAPPPYSAERAEPPPPQPTPPPPGHVTVVPKLGGSPRLLTCPSCRQPVITTVVYESSNKTHLLAGFICGLTLWCMICCVAVLPYYMSCAKVAEHYCPNCNVYIGAYSAL